MGGSVKRRADGDDSDTGEAATGATSPVYNEFTELREAVEADELATTVAFSDVGEFTQLREVVETGEASTIADSSTIGESIQVREAVETGGVSKVADSSIFDEANQFREIVETVGGLMLAPPSDNSSSTQDPSQSTRVVDGTRDFLYGDLPPIEYSKITDLKNISEALGLRGWYAARGIIPPDTLPIRPRKFNNQGKEAAITLNTFNVVQAPTKTVHQYDVAWGGDTDHSKRALVKKIWNSKAVKKALGEPANLWIYDGNKLAWSGVELDRAETRIHVDLDAEEAEELAAQGKPPRKRRERRDSDSDEPLPDNKHIVFLRHTRKVDFEHLQAFLDGNAPWTSECIDTINFMDHLMREGPSKQYTQIKKSFFARGQERYDLGGGLEAFKGVFASLRPVLNDRFEKSLSVNVDVANGTFWRPQELLRAFTHVFQCSIAQLTARFKEARKNWKQSVMRRDFKRFKKLGVVTQHMKGEQTHYIIDELMDKTAYEVFFVDPEDPNKEITVGGYFRRKYNLRVVDHIPLVKMTKKIRKQPIYIPADFLKIDQNQRYNTKLSDVQTSAMIKFAVTLPQARWQAVQHGIDMLKWNEDPYLKHYGLVISQNPSKTKARILPTPEVQFAPGGNVKVLEKDRVAGRWRLDGRKFALINHENPIKAWGVCVIQGRGTPPVEHVKKFLEAFIKTYEAHGGRFLSHPTYGKGPWIGPGSLSEGGDLVLNAYNATGNRYQTKPNFMMFVVCDRNIEVYRRIKKSCDLRFGVASQVVQSKHVIACQPQYLSNVLMKVNAKLGGATCVAKSTVMPKLNPKEASGSIPTMIVGADVSHPAPGAGSAEAVSFAAMTVSCDKHFVRYWADVQTNGHRVEMITTSNIEKHYGDMARKWMEGVGNGRPPVRILYIRDGVSEGQYAAVIEEEVRDMKNVWKRLGMDIPKFTVMIAGKRHHIRFFPEQGDRNKNPIPGTLVEAGCTHPHEWDFYLCAHVAIKGTARPIHYQCILNEALWPAMELQSFIFEHSYQYVRSTTPVSLHPAVYYAHLAADRSRAHTRESPVAVNKKDNRDRTDELAMQKPEWMVPESTGSSKIISVEAPPLLELNNIGGLKNHMWFV